MWIDDLVLKRMAEPIAISCWVPDGAHVVLGASNLPERETHQESCIRDHIPVLKRYGGGGTVVLHSGCVVVSVGLWVKNLYQNKAYFHFLNQGIIDCLTKWNPICNGLTQNGISDICYKSKKIAGTSLFRSKHYLLYQASILIDPKLHLIDRYLKHPSQEPEYRQNRSHSDFLTGLQDVLGMSIPQQEPSKSPKLIADLVAELFQDKLLSHIESLLKDHLLDPQKEHFGALEARIKRNQGTDT